MRITIIFDERDDLTLRNRMAIVSEVLTPVEGETAEWVRNKLTYRTTKSAFGVIDAWTYEGFAVEEFVSLEFSR